MVLSLKLCNVQIVQFFLCNVLHSVIFTNYFFTKYLRVKVSYLRVKVSYLRVKVKVK